MRGVETRAQRKRKLANNKLPNDRPKRGKVGLFTHCNDLNIYRKNGETVFRFSEETESSIQLTFSNHLLGLDVIHSTIEFTADACHFVFYDHELSETCWDRCLSLAILPRERIDSQTYKTTLADWHEPLNQYMFSFYLRTVIRVQHKTKSIEEGMEIVTVEETMAACRKLFNHYKERFSKSSQNSSVTEAAARAANLTA